MRGLEGCLFCIHLVMRILFEGGFRVVVEDWRSGEGLHR